MDLEAEQAAEAILNKARKYKKLATQMKWKITFSDYERFKSELHQNGVFGKEHELANILKV